MKREDSSANNEGSESVYDYVIVVVCVITCLLFADSSSCCYPVAASILVQLLT